MRYHHNSYAILPFYITRIMFDFLAEKVFIGSMSSIAIIFININTILNRLMVCWAVSTDINWRAIALNVMIDFVIVVGCAFIVCGPVHIHIYKRRAPKAFFNWFLGKADAIDKTLNEDERAHGGFKRDW